MDFNRLAVFNKVEFTINPHTTELLRADIYRVINLLDVGVRRVCDTDTSDEAIIMREAMASLAKMCRKLDEEKILWG